ncbi:cysteine-rich KTR domain-containing protein [uncultured Oscillibacter sp.]|nr:cysteine-rich KTR domain-containing protein [uncultured Oscillibacter sp.]
MQIEQWILCPVCKGKTRLKIRADTILKEALIKANKSQANKRR